VVPLVKAVQKRPLIRNLRKENAEIKTLFLLLDELRKEVELSKKTKTNMTKRWVLNDNCQKIAPGYN